MWLHQPRQNWNVSMTRAQNKHLEHLGLRYFLQQRWFVRFWANALQPHQKNAQPSEAEIKHYSVINTERMWLPWFSAVKSFYVISRIKAPSPYLLLAVFSDKEKKMAGAQTAFLLECTGDGLVPVARLVGHLLLLAPPAQPLRALQSHFWIPLSSSPWRSSALFHSSAFVARVLNPCTSGPHLCSEVNRSTVAAPGVDNCLRLWSA